MPIDWNKFRVRLNCAGRCRWQEGIEAPENWDREERRTDHTVFHCWAGSGYLDHRYGRSAFEAGMCVWLRQGQAYDMRQDPRSPLGLNFIHFDLLDGSNRFPRHGTPLPPEVFSPSDPAFTESVCRRITDLLLNKAVVSSYAWAPQEGPIRKTATALLTGLLMDLDHEAAARPAIVGAARPATARQQRRTEQIAQLASDLLETQGRLPSITELARKTGYSTSHFTRIFRDVTGRDPRSYLIEARIHRAMTMLLRTSLPIGEIADELGYRNIFNFSRQFRQKTGQTPTAYRRKGAAWAG